MKPPPRRQEFEFEEADVSHGREVASPAKEVADYGLAGVGGRWSARLEGKQKKTGKRNRHQAR